MHILYAIHITYIHPQAQKETLNLLTEAEQMQEPNVYLCAYEDCHSGGKYISFSRSQNTGIMTWS